MDEGLFIDHVDTEWFSRAGHMGMVAIDDCGDLLLRSLGESTLPLSGGRTRNFPVHKSFRYYYMFRNSLVLYRRIDMGHDWVVADAAQLLKRALSFGIVHPARHKNLAMMSHGIFDGLSGVWGPLRERTTCE